MTMKLSEAVRLFGLRLELKMETKLRLSEAIRLGATMKPQAFCAFYRNGGSCALGAAFDAIGLDPDDPDTTTYPISWSWALAILRECPVCHEPAGIASHLNDVHRWSRERIADFVEVLELEQEMNATNKSSGQTVSELTVQSETTDVNTEEREIVYET